MSARYETTQLFDASGQRKYLTCEERRRFIATADTAAPEIAALCQVLHHTGCRLSEALGLCWNQVDGDSGTLVLRTLKQRRGDVFRVVPIPPSVLDALDHLHFKTSTFSSPIFKWHRATAWSKIKSVMARAGIAGPHACPRGIRHGFGVQAIAYGVPVTLVQRWLGHAKLETTSIYLVVVGKEERKFAERLWTKVA